MSTMDVKELLNALDEIKSITQQVPAEGWSPQFREIANIAHRTPRDHANLEALRSRLCDEFVGSEISIVCGRCVDKLRR